MRKLLSLILCVTLFASCSSDDDNYTNDDIVGSWILQSAKVKEVKTNNEKATQVIKDIIANSDVGTTILFSVDGKVNMIHGDETESGTYSLKGNTLTITVSGKTNSDKIHLSKNSFSSDSDMTSDFQSIVKYLVPEEKDVVVEKVIATYTYIRN